MKNLLLNIPQFPCALSKFEVGETVRAYGSDFDKELPRKDCFIEGVVMKVDYFESDRTSYLDKIKVKWYKKMSYGNLDKYTSPTLGDTWDISTSSPHLVKHNPQLAIPFN